MDWRHEAVCRDEDPELFFPIGDTGPALTQIKQAKSVCRRCPVIETCLKWALETGQDDGVWGGLSEIERRELKHQSTSPPRTVQPPPRRPESVEAELPSDFTAEELNDLLREFA